MKRLIVIASASLLIFLCISMVIKKKTGVAHASPPTTTTPPQSTDYPSSGEQNDPTAASASKSYPPEAYCPSCCHDDSCPTAEAETQNWGGGLFGVSFVFEDNCGISQVQVNYTVYDRSKGKVVDEDIMDTSYDCEKVNCSEGTKEVKGQKRDTYDKYVTLGPNQEVSISGIVTDCSGNMAFSGAYAFADDNVDLIYYTYDTVTTCE